jgi:alkane 1-monooxygenase
MKSDTLKYLLVYVTPAVVFFSIWSADIWSYAAVVLLFGFLPFLELFSSGSGANLSEKEEEAATQNRVYDLIIYGLLPAHYLILIYILVQVGHGGPSPVCAGGHDHCIWSFLWRAGYQRPAHELGHRSTRYEQFMSKLLLLSTLYMHFFIEHNRGHHKNVSTEEDPATSRYGETLYGFYVRTIREQLVVGLASGGRPAREGGASLLVVAERDAAVSGYPAGVCSCDIPDFRILRAVPLSGWCCRWSSAARNSELISSITD